MLLLSPNIHAVLGWSHPTNPVFPKLDWQAFSNTAPPPATTLTSEIQMAAFPGPTHWGLGGKGEGFSFSQSLSLDLQVLCTKFPPALSCPRLEGKVVRGRMLQGAEHSQGTSLVTWPTRPHPYCLGGSGLARESGQAICIRSSRFYKEEVIGVVCYLTYKVSFT